MSTAWWNESHCLAFDLETSGVDTLSDRIVTAAVVRLSAGVRRGTFTWLADPGVDIPEGAAKVHGITTEKARADGRPIAEVLNEVTEHIAYALQLGVPVVAANAAFDLTMLEAENDRHGVASLAQRLGGADRIRPVVDPMVLDKQGQLYRKGPRKLTNLCAHYNVQLTAAHTADADALAAGLLWPAVLREHHRRLPGCETPEGLHDAQVGWRAEHQRSLEEFHRRSGKASGTYDGGWPLHTAWTHPELIGGVA